MRTRHSVRTKRHPVRPGITVGSRSGAPCIQIVTDVDDTLFPSGSPFTMDVKGVDRRRFDGTLYPCVKQVHRAIHAVCGLPTVVVTARPFGITKVARAVEELLGVPVTAFGGDWTSAGALPGVRAYEGIVRRKFDTIARYASEHPERKLIWVGDNGQGDETVGRLLLLAGWVDRAYIHLVHPERGGAPQEGMVFFKNYATVAEDLRRMRVAVQCAPTHDAPTRANQHHTTPTA